MKPDDSRTRDILEVREHLARKAEECETELEYIRRNIAIIDSALKKSSFTRASEMPLGGEPQDAPEPEHRPDPPNGTEPANGKVGDAIPPGASPITAGSRVVGHSIADGGELRIVIDEGIDLRPDTPPLKTFFVDRIIGGMRTKDEAGVQSGQLDGDSVIECSINAEADRIRDIIVRNYRDQKRADEIISTVSWSLARMLEKSG